jgi:hypothetical protein
LFGSVPGSQVILRQPFSVMEFLNHDEKTALP